MGPGVSGLFSALFGGSGFFRGVTEERNGVLPVFAEDFFHIFVFGGIRIRKNEKRNGAAFMKKTLLVFLPLFCLFLLCGCEEQSAARFLPGESFSLRGCFTDEAGVSFSAVFTRTPSADTVAFLAPEALSGMTARAEKTKDGQSYSLTFEDMTVPVGEKAAGFFRAFALLSLSPTGACTREGEFIRFPTAKGEAEIRLDRQGRFLSVLLKTEEGTVSFVSTGGET